MKREKGFTLIELLIVVAILGIIAAMSIPTAYNHFNPDHKERAIEFNLIREAFDKMLETEDIATNDTSVFPSVEHPLYPKYLKERYTKFEYSLGDKVYQK